MRSLAALALALVVGAIPAAAQVPERTRQTVLTIGTGPLRGSYYPVARALCRVVNRELRGQNIRCSPETTYGSVYNLQMMQAGELDFALVQADVQHQAMNGRGDWAGRPFGTLRAVFTAFDEAFVVVAASGSGFTEIEDLRARRVATGVPGSGTRATWDALAAVLGWQGADRVRHVDSTDIPAALCNGTMDAAVAVGFHPVGTVRAQLGACASFLLPVRGVVRDRLLAEHPYFRAAVLPAATYGSNGAIETFGVGTDFVTTARMDPRLVTAILRVALDNREEIAAQVPALAAHRPGGVARIEPIAPLHPAAEAVYRERGMLR